MKIFFILFHIFVFAKVSFADDAKCQRDLKPKLSSTFYLWVDNGGKERLSPIYEKMVRDLKPGGVLVGASEVWQKMETLRALSDSVKGLYPEDELPFLGADFISTPRENEPNAHFALELGFGVAGMELFQPDLYRSSGFGWDQADKMFDENFKELTKSIRELCIETVAKIKAVAHRVVGINHPLGPIVESRLDRASDIPQNNREKAQFLTTVIEKQGLIPTLKHFPFLPNDHNLHDSTASIPMTETNKKTIQENFFVSSNDGYVVMTTHVSSPNVDNDKLVTFSKEWVDSLRKGIGQDNLVMTDGLFMIDDYDEKMEEVTGLPRQTIDRYFGYGSPLDNAYDPCYKASKELIEKYQKDRQSLPDKQYDRVNQKDLVPEWLIEEAKKYRTKRCQDNDDIARYVVTYAWPGFEFDKMEKVGIDTLTGFYEQALLSGHDLTILEGHPYAIRGAFNEVLDRACSNDGKDLKKAIETAANRIKRFKSKNKKKIAVRTSKEWIEENKEDLTLLFQEIYPKINDPQAPCDQDALKKADTIFRRVGC